MFEKKPKSTVGTRRRSEENKSVVVNKKSDVDKNVAKDKMSRKTLHVLQPAATDKENLVGAGRKLRSSTGKSLIPVKNEMSGKMKDDVNKSVSKIAVRKDVSPKKVTNQTKTESKKVQSTKKTGKVFKDQCIQTEPPAEDKITTDDLTSEASPKKSYWKVLAERRRVALQDALEENKILSDQVQVYKEMLDESRALVEVLQEMLGEDGNSINQSLDDSRI